MTRVRLDEARRRLANIVMRQSIGEGLCSRFPRVAPVRVG